MNTIYDKLSRVSFLSKSYSYKFLFIAFVSVYIPLVILIFFLGSTTFQITLTQLVVIVIIVSLCASLVVFYLVNKLLLPLKISKTSLDNYLSNYTLPTLPSHYKDEAGALMQKIQYTLHTLDGLIKEKKDFAALLSHDIRSPLNVFIGLSELIKEEQNKDQINNYCDLIIQESKAQLNFLKDIMEMMEYNDVIIHQEDLQAVPLFTLVHQALESIKSQLLIKHITIDVQVDKMLIIKVQTKLFIQVLHNLLVNAIKFSYPEGKIEISATQQTSTTNICVRDHGIGFRQEDAELMFQRFTKKGRTGTAGEKSTGLGLYLTKTIVQKHSGTISAQSDGENTGALFCIKLPSNFFIEPA